MSKITVKDLQWCVDLVSYKDWEFNVRLDGDRPYLQISCPSGSCNTTGNKYDWKSRKWFLSYHMAKSEVIQTVFKAVITAEEHETRELFKYKGQPIFGPHYDVDKLFGLCHLESLDVREEE